MPLSDELILAANSGVKPRRLFDSSGLYLEVSPVGSKLWRFKYHFKGKEKRLALGAYPATSLKDARFKRDEARKLLLSGVDPGEQRKVAKLLNERSPSLDVETTNASRSSSKNISLDGTGTSNSLSALGVSELEEQVYGVLLAHQKAAAEEVAALLSLSLSKTRLLLGSIESKGLATHSPEWPRRYIATPPEFAAEMLTSQRQADLELARLNMRNMKRFRSSDPEPLEQPVEIITDRTMLNQFLHHLARSAQKEILVFQRGPILFSSFNEGPQESGAQQGRGNPRIRTISDATFLDHPGGLDFIRRDVEAGEEARFFRALPSKLTIVDQRIAIISLSSSDPGGARLLIRTSGLLEALHMLFELIWERATPIAPNGELELDETIPEVSEATDRLIMLLSLGLNDKAIAQEAGISASTITRRIADLMKSFGTRSRFQLGWRAALDAFPERLNADAQGHWPLFR